MKKIVVSGDCNGNLDFLVKKVSALHAKNQFSFMLCLGRVMPIDECEAFSQLKTGRIKLPLPVYFIESGDMAATLSALYPQGKEILPNLFYLGRAGIKNIFGVTIAYLSGKQNDKHSNFYLQEQVEYASAFYTLSDIARLCSEEHCQQPIDILLTNEWPEDSSASPPKEPQNASQYVSRIAERIAPRYHFAGSEGIYFKRKEYLNRKGMATSFISVAPIHKESDNKDKYLHAIQIVPLRQLGKEGLQIPVEGLDPNPFERQEGSNNVSIKLSTLKPSINTPKVKQDFKEPPIIYFQRFSENSTQSEIQEFVERWGDTQRLEIFFDEGRRRHKGCGVVVFKEVDIAKKCLSESGQYSLHGSRIRFSIKNDQNQYTDQNCWFCKESNVFDETLVFHYGKHCYLALDKGPITPEHFQIVPIKHLTNHPGLDQPTKLELFTVYNRLRNYFLGCSKDVVSFERFLNLSHSVNHYIRQSVPVDVTEMDKLSGLFEKKCRQERLNFLKVQQAEFDEHTKGKFYYRLQFGQTIYVCIVKDRHFAIDFGRATLCELLGLTQRVNWKSCVNETRSKQQLTRYMAVLKEIHLSE